MKLTVSHNDYGEIVYEENIWTGKKSVWVGGVKLKREGKKHFVSDQENGESMSVDVEGSYIGKLSLLVNGDLVELMPAPKVYEFILCASIFIFNILFGNVPALAAIFPVVSGALGGAISALFAVLALVVMRGQKNVGLKLLVWLGFFVLSALVCFALVLLLVMLL